MSTPNLDSIKGEILFFMGKIFQFTFVYIGAVFAVLASSNLQVAGHIANFLRVGQTMLAVEVFLLLNFLYLVLSSSCMFAILKRGFFIVREVGPTAPYHPLVRWERFVRKNPRNFNSFLWNIDNHFVAVLFVAVLASSCLAFGFLVSQVGWKRAGIPLLLMILHGLPIWWIWPSWKLFRTSR